jgi:hypothetical protein
MVLGLICSGGAEKKPNSAATTVVASSQPAPRLTAVLDSGSASASPGNSATLVAPLAPVESPVLLKPIALQKVEARHNFFDLRNSLGLAALAVGLTGDALSTQKGLGLPGYHEMNPIARPFVQSRPGAALYSAASFALMGGAMYMAHKANHHKFERVLPFAVAGWEGFLAIRNYHLISAKTH